VKYTIVKSVFNIKSNRYEDVCTYHNVILYQKLDCIYVREYNFGNDENFKAENDPVGSEVGYKAVMGLFLTQSIFNLDEILIIGTSFYYNDKVILKVIEAQALTETEKLQIGI